MRKLTEQQYIDYYVERGQCVDQAFPPKNPMREASLRTRYKAYLRKLEKQGEKLENDKVKAENDPWIETRKEVYIRDDNECQLLWKLDPIDIRTLKVWSSGLHHIIDPAHVFGKGAFPRMKFDVDNVFCLNRFSHSMLDSGKNPINGKPISKEEHRQWWEFIIGKEHYLELEQRSRRK